LSSNPFKFILLFRSIVLLYTDNNAVFTWRDNNIVLAFAVNNLYLRVIAHSLVDAEPNIVGVNLVAELKILFRTSRIFIKECGSTKLSEISIALIVASRSKVNFIRIFDGGMFTSVILN